jgi:hypothetical protein
MQRNLRILAVISTMSVLALAGPCLSNLSTQLAQGQNVIRDNSTISSTVEEEKLFQLYSKPYNLTYGEWTARWWQWAYSIPRDVNPAYDNTGKYCSENQQGPVWFFPGTYGKSVIRECTVPTGKAILFPILNSECSFIEFPELKTIEELRICAKTFQDQVTGLHANIDGQEIPKTELEKYRIQSPPFYFTLPKNNILSLPPNIATDAISDGNWVFVKPLIPGKHEISFRGDVTNIVNNAAAESFSFPSGWNYNTTYKLIIK